MKNYIGKKYQILIKPTIYNTYFTTYAIESVSNVSLLCQNMGN